MIYIRDTFPSTYENAMPSQTALHQPFLVAASGTSLTIKENTYIKVINSGVHNIVCFEADTTFAVADYLDTGVIEVGKDYYLYFLNFIPTGKTLPVLISLNSTFPGGGFGATADNSRKGGGFHTLCVVADITNSGDYLPAGTPGKSDVSWSGTSGGHTYGVKITATNKFQWNKDGGAWNGVDVNMTGSLQAVTDSITVNFPSGTGYTTNDIYYSHPLVGFAAGAILPQSVWCLNSRSSGQQEGHVLDPYVHRWAGIYMQSSTGATTASAYGATITDTRVWNDHVDDLAAVGDRLPDDGEFSSFAKGSNDETNIVGSADPVTTGGHYDTLGRRMISNIGCEDCCGVMYQWLRTQSWRYDIGTPTFSVASQTHTIYHEAAPDGNPVYVKFTADGTPYLCCNMAIDAVDKVLTFGTNYKIVVKHDAVAATGIQLYFDYDATLPFRFLINNTILGKDCYAFSNDPNFMLCLKHDASAATNGVAITFDDNTDERLEYISPGAADRTMDLCTSGLTWGWRDMGSNKGSLYRQGTSGDIKFLAGGLWDDAEHCGPRCLNTNNCRWESNSHLTARGCAEPM